MPFCVQEINTVATIASFKVYHVLVKRMKPFEDGEVIKEAMTEAANVLFDSFSKKTFIMSVIAKMQFSPNTVTRRVEYLSRNTKEQLAMDIDNCEFF